MNWRPRGTLGSEVQLAYLVELLCPGIKEITIQTRKLPDSQQAQITRKHSKKSLRELAKEYGVSYETVRRTIRDVYYSVTIQAFVPLLVSSNCGQMELKLMRYSCRGNEFL